MEHETSLNNEKLTIANVLLAEGRFSETDFLTVVSLGLDKCWDTDWIISTSQTTGGVIHFSVHLGYIGQIDTNDVEIQTIEMDGCWLRLSGWVR